MVEVLRKNQFKTVDATDLKSFGQMDFNQQQTVMKNEISKKYTIKLVTSFNERTVFGVIGKNEVNAYFYAIDKNRQNEISFEQMKKLF